MDLVHVMCAAEDTDYALKGFAGMNDDAGTGV
jgi:hypothetical protein